MDVDGVLTSVVVTDGRPTLGSRSRKGTQATEGRRGDYRVLLDVSESGTVFGPELRETLGGVSSLG